MPRDVVVTDLSESGCRIEDRSNDLRLGAFISIRIGNIGPITAEVKWIHDADVGIQFTSAIYQSVLDHMLNTLDGWKPANMHAGGGKETSEQPLGPPVRVRQVTINDVREVLANSPLSLPISGYQEIIDLFQHLLECVTVKDSDASEGTG